MHDSWKTLFLENADQLLKISEILDNCKETILPNPDVAFNAFKVTPLSDVKVVILGQDPYYQPGLANGLAFSVSPGVKVPDSLLNVYDEIERSLGLKMNKKNGDLTPWAEQGVLLLNRALSVIQDKPRTHLNVWSPFIKKVLIEVGQNENVVFMIWGKDSVGFFENYVAHQISAKYLYSGHPSPNNTTGSFLGSNCFKKANEFLESKKLKPINWEIN